MKLFMTSAIVAAVTTVASAGLHDVTPDVIFGSGNANGNFTIATNSGIELGMRAKIPFAGTTHYDGGHTYTYAAGQVWNFDWSVNSNVDGTGANLSAFTYELSMFKVNSLGTNPADAFTFDLINLTSGFADHAIGTNSTGNGAGTEATDSTEYATLIANNNVAQNSWRYGFFPFGAISTYDVNDIGTYIVRLTAFSGGMEVVSTDVTVNVVPLPTAAFAGLGLLGALGGVRTIRRRM